MPLYEYRCESCGHQFEVIQKYSDAPIDVCPNCKSGPVVKLLSSPAFQFKGSGWYITDYARKDSKGAEGGKGADRDKGSERDKGGEGGKGGKGGERGKSADTTSAATTTASVDSSSSTPAPKADPKSGT